MAILNNQRVIQMISNDNPFANKLTKPMAHRSSWICSRTFFFFRFSNWLIHHDWETYYDYSILKFFLEVLSKSKLWGFEFLRRESNWGIKIYSRSRCTVPRTTPGPTRFRSILGYICVRSQANLKAQDQPWRNPFMSCFSWDDPRFSNWDGVKLPALHQIGWTTNLTPTFIGSDPQNFSSEDHFRWDSTWYKVVPHS